MTWEGELRQLEEQLASGALSAEEYRLARDRLLMQSQGSTAPAGSSHGQEQPRMGQPPHHGQLFPPPSAAEATNVMRPIGRDDLPPGQPNVFNRASGPDSTQVVHPVPGGIRPDKPEAPPWGGDNGSEPVMAPDASWLRQGSSAFETKQSHKGRIVGIVLVTVLVVGVAVAGVFYATTGKSSPTAQSGGTNQSAHVPTPTRALPVPPPTKPRPVDNDHALIDPPGKTRGGGGSFNLSKLRANRLLPKPIVAALDRAGMRGGILKTTTDHGMTIGMYAMTVANSQSAEEVAHDYGTVQMEGGLPSNSDLAMVGVPVFSTPTDSKNSVYRSVYVLYNTVIIIEVFGPDHSAVEQRFEQLLQKQVKHAPPTVRNS